MNPSPAVVVALLLLLAALALTVVAVVELRPRTVMTTTQLAPGSQPRVHERTPSARRTPRRRAGRRNARPASSPTPVATAEPVPVSQPIPTPEREAAATPPPRPPETVVTTYYRALDAGRFDAAWTTLTPAVRSTFGDFERWRDGYATTLSSTPRDIEVATDGATATVAHELVTEDRSSCGPVKRRFAVRWKLVLAENGWRAASLSGVKRAGPEPAEACPERHDPARVAGGR